MSGPKPSQLYKQGVLTLLNELKDEAVSLVDTIAPSDFVMNSPLGMSDGNMYAHLQSRMVQTPATFERPSWWQDVVYWKRYTSHTDQAKSKL